MKRILEFSLICLPFMGSMACNDLYGLPGAQFPDTVQTINGPLTEFSEDGQSEIRPEGFVCPVRENIVPAPTNDIAQQKEYTACRGDKRSKEILITLDSSTTYSVCVFPIFTQEDRSSSQIVKIPTEQCGRVNRNGMIISFGNTANEINTIAIVPESARNQMRNCIIQNDRFLCPDHSIGKLKDI